MTDKQKQLVVNSAQRYAISYRCTVVLLRIGGNNYTWVKKSSYNPADWSQTTEIVETYKG